MGCSSSNSEPSAQQARPVQIGRPQDITLHVPRRQKDAEGAELQVVDQELTRQNIHRALQYTAQYLNERRQNLTLVTVGGAINTMYLRSRQTTHDVDFFGAHLNQRQLQMIDEAMQYAERMSSVPLGGAWLNNESRCTWLRMLGDTSQTVQLEQDMVVFKEPGLTVVAAPWSYSFISKSQRLGSQYERPYDLDDAVAYLAEWNRRMGNEVATARMIQDLCARYRQPMIADPVLRRVNERYRTRHRRDGIRT
ncbi:Hypothetical predicted protein [Lecanosticta acicola]|uniref:DUF7582 domain-containing protein n=1 Tax=Lecanosticta acicola TaxID=111012 RepID=A0AAI8YSQ5_9PEZI|nr:Hypothetical predicted protein [Lecanosticta acicola]